MAVYGIGTDLERIEKVAEILKNPAFLPRFFGEAERAELASRGNPPASVCAAFCVKEAFGKALGIGLRYPLREVELVHEPGGKPSLKLSGSVLSTALSLGLRFHVSVSHTADYAVATVLAEKEAM